jgi:response regulator RpfG family c-di-GMP phosphodiesterase
MVTEQDSLGLSEYRVLVVDDDEDVRLLLSRALSKFGIKVDTAEDGVVAENMLRCHKYDGLISDLVMPRKHGHSLITDVIGQGYVPVVIAMTSVLEPKLVLDLMTRGVADFVQKPLNYEAFSAKVMFYLERTSSAPSRGQHIDSLAPTKQAASTGGVERAKIKRLEHVVVRLEEQQESLEARNMGFVRVFANLVSQFGETKHSHVGRVENMAAYMGSRLGLSSEQLQQLRMAALLHDIGQCGMPDQIRRTPPWQLEGRDRELYERYPLIGAALLGEIPGAEPVANLVEAHAENYNGTGFPAKKKGKEIPAGARIVRICDDYENFMMFSEESGSSENAKLYLAAKRGVVHDPELFPLALAYLEDAVNETDADSIKTVPARFLARGMVLADSLYDAKGVFLVRQGAILNDYLVERLHHLLTLGEVRVK